MIEIIWAVLNIGIFISFFLISAKAVKLLKENLGIIASILFILGLMSFASRNKNSFEDDNKIFNLSKSHQELRGNHNGFITDKTVEKNLASEILLSLVLNKENGEINAKSCSVTKTGLNAGCYWNPRYVNISKIDNSTFSYDIQGEYNWKLFGIKLFTTSKNLKGIIKP